MKTKENKTFCKRCKRTESLRTEESKIESRRGSICAGEEGTGVAYGVVGGVDGKGFSFTLLEAEVPNVNWTATDGFTGSPLLELLLDS